MAQPGSTFDEHKFAPKSEVDHGGDVQVARSFAPNVPVDNLNGNDRAIVETLIATMSYKNRSIRELQRKLEEKDLIIETYKNALAAKTKVVDDVLSEQSKLREEIEVYNAQLVMRSRASTALNARLQVERNRRRKLQNDLKVIVQSYDAEDDEEDED